MNITYQVTVRNIVYAQLLENLFFFNGMDEETKLLDAINRALRKWGIKEKLPFEDGFYLLTTLQEEIVTKWFEENQIIKTVKDWLVEYNECHDYEEVNSVCEEYYSKLKKLID